MALKNLDDKENVKMLDKEKLKLMKQVNDSISGNLNKDEIEWLIEKVERLEEENQSLTERFHKQAEYIINLEAKIERLK